MKKLFLIIYIFLIAFSSFASFEVYAQGDSCASKLTEKETAEEQYKTIKYNYDTCKGACGIDGICEAGCEITRSQGVATALANKTTATKSYKTCIQNNQSNLSDYEFCKATIANGAPVENCIPGDTKFYGRSCNKCCDGTTYDSYRDGDAKECCETNNIIIGTVSDDNLECIECEECRDLYQDVSDALAEMEGYANSQTERPPQDELESFQGTIKTAYDKYKNKKCKEAFPNNDYSKCPDSTTNTRTNTGTNTTTASSTQAGISCNQEQLLYGQCKLNIYDTLGIRQSDGETSVGLFVQDIVLSATMFIGTIVTIAIVVSGLMFVFGGANPELQSKAKKGLINAIIGLLIVMSSYVIIRLIQFIVKGG